MSNDPPAQPPFLAMTYDPVAQANEVARRAGATYLKSAPVVAETIGDDLEREDRIVTDGPPAAES